jgi:hypothetical protein
MRMSTADIARSSLVGDRLDVEVAEDLPPFGHDQHRPGCTRRRSCPEALANPLRRQTSSSVDWSPGSRRRPAQWEPEGEIPSGHPTDVVGVRRFCYRVILVCATGSRARPAPTSTASRPRPRRPALSHGYPGRCDGALLGSG